MSTETGSAAADGVEKEHTPNVFETIPRLPSIGKLENIAWSIIREASRTESLMGMGLPKHREQIAKQVAKLVAALIIVVIDDPTLVDQPPKIAADKAVALIGWEPAMPA